MLGEIGRLALEKTVADGFNINSDDMEMARSNMRNGFLRNQRSDVQFEQPATAGRLGLMQATLPITARQNRLIHSVATGGFSQEQFQRFERQLSKQQQTAPSAQTFVDPVESFQLSNRFDDMKKLQESPAMKMIAGQLLSHLGIDVPPAAVGAVPPEARQILNPADIGDVGSQAIRGFPVEEQKALQPIPIVDPFGVAAGGRFELPDNLYKPSFGGAESQIWWDWLSKAYNPPTQAALRFANQEERKEFFQNTTTPLLVGNESELNLDALIPKTSREHISAGHFKDLTGVFLRGVQTNQSQALPGVIRDLSHHIGQLDRLAPKSAVSRTANPIYRFQALALDKDNRVTPYGHFILSGLHHYINDHLLEQYQHALPDMHPAAINEAIKRGDPDNYARVLLPQWLHLAGIRLYGDLLRRSIARRKLIS